jgi:hypothetical protein
MKNDRSKEIIQIALKQKKIRQIYQTNQTKKRREEKNTDFFSHIDFTKNILHKNKLSHKQ